MMTTTMTFSTHQGALRHVIRDHMRRACLNTKALSTMAGFHEDYMGHVLGARRDVTVAVLNAVAPVLGTTTAQLHKEAKALES
jgi:hypothetical protein